MLYSGYQALTDMMMPARTVAAAALWLRDEYFPGLDEWPMPRYMLAFCESFGVAAVTDVFDGWLARRFGWQSELGGMLDPDVRASIAGSMPSPGRFRFADEYARALERIRVRGRAAIDA